MSYHKNYSNNTNYQNQNQPTQVFCVNCGSNNHNLKECKDYVISLGIICIQNHFKNKNNNKINTKELFKTGINDYVKQKNISGFNLDKFYYTKNYKDDDKKYFDENSEYCLICRRNSIGYVEFIRGKYSFKRKNYIKKLFSLMSKNELEDILANDFETLWKKLWLIDDKKFVETNDYLNSRSKFLILKTGVKFDDSEDIVNMNDIIKQIQFVFEEPEWMPPKGRRNVYETDLDASIREFCEETNLNNNDINVLNIKPLIEIYRGSNNIMYKTIYYIAEYVGDLNTTTKLKSRGKNDNQKVEISDIAWCNIKKSTQLIRGYHKEKKRIMKYVHLSLFKFYDLYIRKKLN